MITILLYIEEIDKAHISENSIKRAQQTIQSSEAYAMESQSPDPKNPTLHFSALAIEVGK